MNSRTFSRKSYAIFAIVIVLLQFGLATQPRVLINGNTVDWTAVTELLSSSYTIDGVSIMELRQNDGTGAPVHLDEIVATTGIVTTAAEFGATGPAYMQSEEAGIAIYGADLVSQLTSGDLITITSKVGFYNGLTQFVYDLENSSITVEGSVPIPNARLTSIPEILNQRWDGFENLEGSLLKLENVSFQTQGDFAGNTNYIVSDGSNTLDIRIDNDVNLVGTPIPTTSVNIIGVLSQFDSSSPYSEGYQIMPRSLADIVTGTTPPTLTQQDVTVTFSVDMTGFEGSKISLQGGTLPLDWNPGSTILLNQVGKEIYTTEITFPSGTEKSVEYKYMAFTDTGWVWESFDGNRSFDIDDSSPTQILPTDEYNVVGGGDMLAAPSNLTATAISSSQINLNWTDNSDDEVGFTIYRSTDRGISFYAINSLKANVSTYQDIGLAPATEYVYQVQAYSIVCSSDFSNMAFATTQSSGSGTHGVSIMELRQNDGTGTPVHLDEIAATTGIVTTAAEFGATGPAYMQSEEAGIAIYGADLVSQLTSGDLITITSKVGFYNGLTQFVFDPENSAITVEGSVPIPNARLTSIPEILNQRWDGFENLEGSLLKLENVSFQTQGNFAGNTNYIVSDGSNTLDIRIDNDVNLVGTPIPTTSVNIIGVLSQFDSSSPYSSGYQLLPRYVSDITESGGGSGESTVWDFETGLENWQVNDGTAATVPLHPFNGLNAVQVSDNPEIPNNTLTFFNNTYTGFTPSDVIKVHIWIDDLSGINGVQPFIQFGTDQWFNSWYNAADLTPRTWNELQVIVPADYTTPLIMFGVQVVGINAESLPGFFVDLVTVESSNLESRLITFRADISDLLEEGFQPGMHQLEVRGDFSNWGTGAVLEPIGETTYGVTIPVHGNAGQNILWKFAVSPGETFLNNSWELGANRSFPFPAADTTLAVEPPNIYSSRKTIAEARNIGIGRVVPTGGVLTTPNYGAGSTEYALQDASAGIILYVPGIEMPVNYRDQLEVTGRIVNYNGKLELIPESYDGNLGDVVIVTESNAVLPAVQTLSIPQILANGEEYESELVRIDQVNIQDGTWPAENQNANLTIADQTGNPFTMRIDKETNIDGSAQPESDFNVVGVITQFDDSEPYTDGYQILPRFLSDIITGSSEPGNYNITFQADLTNFIANGWFDPANPADSIVVNGDFNAWDSHQRMLPSETSPNIYQSTVVVTGHPGDAIGWKFRIFPDAKWTNSGWESIENRVLTLSESDILLDPVEPVIHYRGTPTTQDVSVTFSVDLTNTPENFSGISLQGDALPLNWSLGSNPMTDDDSDGIYTLDVLFPAGTGKAIDYKYAARTDTGWVWEAFDGNRHFDIDDSSPTQILPTDEYNVSGSISNACAFFNGQNSRLRAADNSPINPAANPSAYTITGKTITVEAWVFPIDLPDNGKSTVLVSRPYWNADPWYAYELRINNFGSDDEPRFDFAVSDGNPGGASIGALSSTSISVGQWTHVAGTYDGSFLRLYLNGELVGEAAFTENIGSGNAGLYIGGTWSSSFEGAIDEVRLWNVCRSQADIQSAMTEPLSGDEAGLVGYWPLDEAVEVNEFYPVSIDLTANHNDLLLQYGARIVSGAAPAVEPQASPEFQAQALYGVVNSGFVYRPLCYGWPEPTLNLFNGPEGMVVSEGLLNWTPTQPGHYSIQLEANNSAGTSTANYHIWVDPVQVSTDVHNNNNTLLSVFNNGVIGDSPYGPTGNGFQYNGANGLFSGTLIIANNPDQVAGELYDYEFGTLEPVQPITSSLTGFDQAYESRFNDERMANFMGVEIIQRTHSKSTAPDQDYVLIEYKIHNKSAAPLNDLYIGLAMDWDIGSDPTQNFGGYDTENRLSYAYLNSESPYFGISALTGQVSGHKTWLINSVVDEGSDEFLYHAMQEFTDPPSSAGDIRNILGTGPYTIPENGSVNAVFAIIGGDNLGDLRVNASAAAAVDLNGEIPELSHFSPVYSGNPYMAMNFYITAATVDGVSLSIGDEIGIFDGNVCVGAGVVTGGFDPYLDLVASTDDPTTTEKDGFTAGQPISYRLWDKDQSLEISSVQPSYSTGDGNFASQGTAVLSLAGSLSISQNLNLEQGWNIVSFYAIPSNVDMLNIFQELTGNGSLIKIQDETGNAVENVTGIGWVNNIDNLAVTEGYYVKVTAAQTLNIEGSAITLPLDIPLSTGWNIMGYPASAPQSALNIVQPLIDEGKLLKVQDETGKAIEELPSIGWQNGIGNFEPGKGYYIKVNREASAIIDQQSQKSAVAKSLAVSAAAPPNHYLPIITTNPYLPMNVYVMRAEVEGEPLKAGAEIAVYHQDRCIAAAALPSPLNSDNTYLPLIIGADDPLSEAADGFGENDPILFKMWDGNEELIVSVRAVKYADNPGLLKFNARGTIVVNLEGTRIPKEYCLRQNYPNPFNPTTTLRYELPEPGKVEVRIFDLQGRLVNQLVSEYQEVGKYSVVWNGCDNRGYQVPSGIYIYQLKSGSFCKTRKAVLMK